MVVRGEMPAVYLCTPMFVSYGKYVGGFDNKVVCKKKCLKSTQSTAETVNVNVRLLRKERNPAAAVYTHLKAPSSHRETKLIYG